ncbi:hypothetical protein [Pseudomonas sp. GM55]|uniref:hypothetical protein n=1 Tax=Pseudomonas sp. GM55 TaxID=1144333 RepID=UPI0002709EFF|nr:hypothetical protein [Pseudomonas sp. GM55]EJM76480.1 hypothetical protein PMI31_01344 [Pseudomonas sp. GM55]
MNGDKREKTIEILEYPFPLDAMLQFVSAGQKIGITSSTLKLVKLRTFIRSEKDQSYLIKVEAEDETYHSTQPIDVSRYAVWAIKGDKVDTPNGQWTVLGKRYTETPAGFDITIFLTTISGKTHEETVSTKALVPDQEEMLRCIHVGEQIGDQFNQETVGEKKYITGDEPGYQIRIETSRRQITATESTDMYRRAEVCQILEYQDEGPGYVFIIYDKRFTKNANGDYTVGIWLQ